jgi:hypothetical protein
MCYQSVVDFNPRWCGEKLIKRTPLPITQKLFYSNLRKGIVMSGAGKGDTYRKVDKNKFDASYEAIFGKKEVRDFQNGLKTVKKNESKQTKAF